MTERVYSILYLCTGNSARSILAEGLTNMLAAGRFRAYSAGSHPAGQVNPYAVELLRRINYPTEKLRSKSCSMSQVLGAYAGVAAAHAMSGFFFA